MELIHNKRCEGYLEFQKLYEKELERYSELANLLAVTDPEVFSRLKEEVDRELELANKKLELLWGKELPIEGVLPKQLRLLGQKEVLDAQIVTK